MTLCSFQRSDCAGISKDRRRQYFVRCKESPLLGSKCAVGDQHNRGLEHIVIAQSDARCEI